MGCSGIPSGSGWTIVLLGRPWVTVEVTASEGLEISKDDANRALDSLMCPAKDTIA